MTEKQKLKKIRRKAIKLQNALKGLSMAEAMKRASQAD